MYLVQINYKYILFNRVLALLSNALRYCEAHQTGNISKKLKSIIIVKKIDSTN
jgi:hypothetical protein